MGAGLRAAQELIDAASEDSKQAATETDEKETEALRAALGGQSGGRMPRGTAGAMKELEEKQKRRRTRSQRDSLDLALVDLTSFYRDVLALQFGSSPETVANVELRDALERIAEDSTAAATLRRIEAIAACREALDRNVAPLLAVEAMAMAIRAG